MHSRFVTLLICLFFPPLAVMLQTGFSPETVLNVLLYMLGILPSYIHGFYVLWRAFHREDLMEQHQWDAVQRKHRKRSRSSSGSTASNRSHHSRRPVYGEVEEYSEKGYDSSPRWQYRQQQLPMRPAYELSGVPPPCPDPPMAHERRYLQ